MKRVKNICANGFFAVFASNIRFLHLNQEERNKLLVAQAKGLGIDKVEEKWFSIPEQNFGIYVGPTMQVLDPVIALIKVRTMMREVKTLFAINKFKTNKY